MNLFSRRTPTPIDGLTGDHIREYVIAEPGYFKIRVVRIDDGWALKRGTIFTKTLAIVSDLDTAIRQARKLSVDLYEQELAEAKIRAAKAKNEQNR